ncbi:MAG: hypothetical protein ACRDID_01080, partial [Ktedonobacterales bacterium]
PTPSPRDAGTSATPRKAAAIPSLRGPETRLGWSRGALSFGAAATALIVIVVAATLFSLRGRPSGGVGSGHANATTTALAQLGGVNGSVTGGAVMGVSMDSPTDGWAVGQPGSGSANPTPAGGNTPTTEAVFYHFNGSVWVQAARVATFQSVTGDGIYLKMLSPSDGWAYDGDNHLLRYDGSAWRAATISLPGATSVYIQSIAMTSPSLGWAAVNVNAGPTNSGLIRFARYDGAGWTLEPITNLPTNADTSQLTIMGISVTPQGDAWAVGAASPISPIPSASGIGLVFHRVNGQWVTQAPLNTPQDTAALNPHGIYMSSPTSGWIVGDVNQNQTSTEGTTLVTHALLLHYDGQRWTRVDAPLNTVTQFDSLTQIAGVGPDNIWVSGRGNAGEILPTGGEMSALLLHFDGQSWSQVWPDALATGATGGYVSNSGIDVTADGALWAVGIVQNSQSTSWPAFWRYSGGAWSAQPVTSGA